MLSLTATGPTHPAESPQTGVATDPTTDIVSFRAPNSTHTGAGPTARLRTQRRFAGLARGILVLALLRCALPTFASSQVEVDTPLTTANLPPGEAEVLRDLLRGPMPPSEILAGDDAFLIQRQVVSWAAAWSEQDTDRYLDHYAETFEPSGSYSGLSFDQWRDVRRQRLEAPQFVRVGIANMTVDTQGDQARARFEQSYSSDTFSDWVRKELFFQRFSDGWRIVREGVVQP